MPHTTTQGNHTGQKLTATIVEESALLGNFSLIPAVGLDTANMLD